MCKIIAGIWSKDPYLCEDRALGFDDGRSAGRQACLGSAWSRQNSVLLILKINYILKILTVAKFITPACITKSCKHQQTQILFKMRFLTFTCYDRFVRKSTVLICVTDILVQNIRFEHDKRVSFIRH